MTTVKSLKFDYFMHLFNYGVSDIKEPKEEEPLSFNVMYGDFIKTYESSVSEKEMRKFALDKISHIQVSKQMKIIEPEELFDYEFFKNNILETLGVDEDRIFLKEINLISRDNNISTYSITANIYPKLYSVLKNSVLKKPFSLENLYYVFVGATDEEKKIIVDYLNSLKFTCTNNINYYNAKKIANQGELKFLNLVGTYNDRLKKVLDEATRNSYIIGLFNIDNPLLEIPTPTCNTYVDDLMSFKKLTQEKETQQLQKKRKNLLKYIEEDIDD